MRPVVNQIGKIQWGQRSALSAILLVIGSCIPQPWLPPPAIESETNGLWTGVPRADQIAWVFQVRQRLVMKRFFAQLPDKTCSREIFMTIQGRGRIDPAKSPFIDEGHLHK